MEETRDKQWGLVYAVIGVILIVLSLVHITLIDPESSAVHTLLYGVFSFGTGAGVVFGGYRHYRNPFPSVRYRRINGWFFLSGLFVTVVGLVSLYVGSTEVLVREILDSGQLLINMGLAIGLLIGTLEARSMRNAKLAGKSERLESEEQRLRLLNDLLNHYMLNGLTIIDGFGQRLESSTDGHQKKWARKIRTRSTTMMDLVHNIGVLTRSVWKDSEMITIDLGNELGEMVESVCEEHITLILPEKATTMYANVGYENGIELLVTGVNRAMDEEGTIEIAVYPDEGFVSMVAHPVEFPNPIRHELEEPIGSGIGLPLFLSKQILEPAIEMDVRTRDDETIEIRLQGDIERPDG